MPRSLLSNIFATVVLPEPGKPHTMINLGPLPDSIKKLSPVGEDGCQFLRRDYFELGVGTINWLFVCSPSAELGHVTEAASLHVLVRDFHHEFGPHWFPGYVLALTPAALATRHALRNSGFIGLGSVFRPGFPGVSDERVLAVRLEEFREFAALLCAEACTHADMLQRPSIVVEAQQQ